MKKILSLLLAIAMLFVLTACKGDASSTADSTVTSSSDTSSDIASSSSSEPASDNESSSNGAPASSGGSASSSTPTASSTPSSNNNQSSNNTVTPSSSAISGSGAEYVDGSTEAQKKLFGELSGTKLRVADDPVLEDWKANFYTQLKATTGMTVEIIPMSESELVSKITQAVASGSKENYFDVATVSNRTILSMIYQKLLLPMDQYIAKDDPVWRYSENSKVLAPELFEIGGYTWGVPSHDYHETYIFYNKTHFKNVGAPDPYTEYYLKNNWTFDTFMTTCRAVTTSNVSAWASWNYFSFASAAGNDMIARNSKGEWEIIIDRSNGMAALDLLYQSSKNGWLDSSTAGYQEFISGDLAMLIATPEAIHATDAYARMSDEIGLVPMPKLDASQKSYIAPLDASGYGIAACAQNPDGAAAYIYYLRIAEQERDKTEFGQQNLLHRLDRDATQRRNEYLSKCAFSVPTIDGLDEWYSQNRKTFLNTVFKTKPSDVKNDLVALIYDSLKNTVG